MNWYLRSIADYGTPLRPCARGRGGPGACRMWRTVSPTYEGDPLAFGRIFVPGAPPVPDQVGPEYQRIQVRTPGQGSVHEAGWTAWG
jgi:hypothetical protein